MQQAVEHDVIVIGAGIGGLTAALALQRKGIRVQIFEQAERLLPLGAGLSLWTNALRVLDRLGVGEAVRQAGMPIRQLELRTSTGRTLSTIPIESIGIRLGAPSILIHRAALHHALAQNLDARVLHLGYEFVRFDQSDQGLTARFANGEEARGSVLVGADGTHSAIRAQLFGQQQPRFAGQMAWLGIADFEHQALPPSLLIESWGCDSRFGVGSLPEGHRYWYALANAAHGNPRAQPGRKADVLRFIQGWQFPFEALVEATDEENITCIGVFDRPPQKQWGIGPVTLLGDAAHPMTPNLGQGACQAIEDAFVLAECLEQHESIEAALRAYSAARWRRTALMVRWSRLSGRIAQPSSKLACNLRNKLMSLIPDRLEAYSMASLFSQGVA